MPDLHPPQDINWGEEIILDPDPVRQFTLWYAEAFDAGLPAVNAMALATATPDGVPSVRMVLLKEHGPEGFIFFTNYNSPKAHDLETNPRAELAFYWDPLQRQVRIAGSVQRVAQAASDAYFHSRPRESQIGAWASHQSEVLASRADLIAAYRKIEALHANEEIPLPPNWGGYALIPDKFEFWIGQPHRLHDRFGYRKTGPGAWLMERLAP